MQKSLLIIALALFAAGCAKDREMGAPDSSSQKVVGGASGTLAAQDATFVTEAAQSGNAEVKIGQLAAKNSETDAIRRFGQTMVTDHTKMNQELKQIATRKAASVPTDLGKHQAHYDQLAALKGGEFDAAFKEHEIKDHEEAVQLFEKQSQQGGDADLKAFAQKHLAHLREHLTKAQQLPGGQTTDESSTTTQQNSDTPTTQQK